MFIVYLLIHPKSYMDNNFFQNGCQRPQAKYGLSKRMKINGLLCSGRVGDQVSTSVVVTIACDRNSAEVFPEMVGACTKTPIPCSQQGLESSVKSRQTTLEM
jgi:hypothetical protein